MKEDDATRRTRLEEKVAGYTPEEFPCYYDATTGKVNCFPDCDSWYGFDSECPVDTLYSARRELARMSMRRFLARAFSDPEIARGNDLLPDDLFMSDR